MTFKELEKTIKLCIKLGVAEIKLGETHVIFGISPQAPQKPRKAEVVAQARAEQHANLQTQADTIRDEIEVSHVEDPLAYEDAISDGLLTDGDRQSTKEEKTNDHRAQ